MMSKNIQKNLISIMCWLIIITIIYFAFTLIFYGQSGLAKDQLVKETWNVTTTFFSGICTLGTGIIAALLVTDWKKSIQYSEQLKALSQLLNEIDDLRNAIYTIRRDQNRGEYLANLFDHINNGNNIKNFNLVFIAPDFTYIKNQILKIKKLGNHLLVYSNKDLDIHNTIQNFEKEIDLWIEAYEYFKNRNFSNHSSSEIFDMACFCSSAFYYLRIKELQAYHIYSHNELEIYYSITQLHLEMAEYRKELDSY